MCGADGGVGGCEGGRGYGSMVKVQGQETEAEVWMEWV